MSGPLDLADPAALIGKVILVGLTYVNPDGSIAGQEERFGPITEVSTTIIFFQDEGEAFSVPFDVSAMVIAQPGYYRFRNREGGVENPDILAQWTIYPNEEAFTALNQKES